MSQHWITVTAETEDADADYSLECSGVDATCRLFEECQECEVTEERIEDGEWEAHGQHHQMIESYGMVETDRCLVLHMVPEGDSPWWIVETVDPGRYPVDFEYEGDGYASITLGVSPGENG